MATGNPLMGTWRKKLGNMVFYRRKGEQVARAYNDKPHNPQTRPQSIQRSRLKPVVTMHRVLDGVTHGVLRVGETQYNGFIKANLKEPRPGYLDPSTQAVYPGIYPKLVPPLPRIGLGGGLPVLMPYIVTIGRFPEPYYGVGIQGATGNIIGYNAVQGNIGQITFSFLTDRLPNAIGVLTNLGITFPDPSGTINLTPFIAEQFVNFLISNYINIHTGFLLSFMDSTYTVFQSLYKELGDIKETTATIDYTNDGTTITITSFNGTLTNSDGDVFNIVPYLADNYFRVQLLNYITPTYIGSGSSVILSRRSGSTFEVSTSRMMLSRGAAQAAYLSMFNPEVEEAAITDYTKTISENDGLNFELTA